MMKGLVHQNIQPVIGSCLDESPPYVIYPYSTEGNLKKFLLKCRVSDCGSIYVSIYNCPPPPKKKKWRGVVFTTFPRPTLCPLIYIEIYSVDLYKNS